MKTYYFLVLIIIFAVGCSNVAEVKDNSGNTGNTGNALKEGVSDLKPDSTIQENNPGTTGTTLADVALFEEYMSGYEKSLSLKEYMVAYDLKNFYEGESIVKQAIYKKGTNERADMVSSQLEIRGITTQEKSTSCTKDIQSGQSEWTCFEVKNKQEALSGANNVELNITASEEDVKQEKVIFGKDGTINIAGTIANCWKTQRPADKFTDRTCISKEGIMLYSRSDADGKITEIIATAYALSVSDDVFVVPQGAKVETTADLIAGMGLSCSDCELMPEDSKADCLASCN